MAIPIKASIATLLTQALRTVASEHANIDVVVERPKQAQHGDYACNVALQLAKPLKRNPRELASALVAALPKTDWIEKTEIAGAGFINITLRPYVKQSLIKKILLEGDKFGRSHKGAGKQVQIEFVSANPTGPLHVGHGRQGAIGDAIACVLDFTGWHVYREFYYNDAGAQINNLGLSVQARIKQRQNPAFPFPQDGYHGEYVQDIANNYVAQHPEDTAADNLSAITTFAVTELRKEQDHDLDAFGIHFDNYYLESSLYTDGKVEETVKQLVASGKAYEEEGALWLKTTEFGDAKNRVMRKSDGSYTYFVPDVAYHITKWKRGFGRVINVQGSDHHSTVDRVRAGLQALNIGIPKGYPEYVLHQMVTVMRDGMEVKISKRAGSYVTVRDLIDEVGRDAVRFFFLLRKSDAHLVFDINLAKTQSDENPVYYVQYAHARICSVFAQAEAKEKIPDLTKVDLAPLVNAKELILMQRLSEFPDLIDNAARDLSPHLLAFYAKDLAADWHSYYNAERILVDDAQVRYARLALAQAVRQVLASSLALLGVRSPEKM